MYQDPINAFIQNMAVFFTKLSMALSNIRESKMQIQTILNIVLYLYF